MRQRSSARPLRINDYRAWSQAEQGCPSRRRSASASAGGATPSPPPGCVADDALGLSGAQLTITNNSSGRSDYFVTVAWETEDGSTRHTDALGSAMSIEPDQSTSVTASALEEVPDDAVCRVIEVQRTASN